jgi:hypothetical protein
VLGFCDNTIPTLFHQLRAQANKADPYLGVRSITYREVFDFLSGAPDSDPERVEYVRERYFS